MPPWPGGGQLPVGEDALVFLSAILFGLVVLADDQPTRLVCTGNAAQFRLYADRPKDSNNGRSKQVEMGVAVNFADTGKTEFGAVQLSGPGIAQKFFAISGKRKDVRAFFGGGMGGIFNTPDADRRVGFGRLGLNPAAGALEFEITCKSPKTKTKSARKSLR